MSKKDDKGRVLRLNEDQMPDGRYRYRYVDVNGRRKAVYSWRLNTTDKTPKGKVDKKSIRELEEEIQIDLMNGIIADSSCYTVNSLVEQYIDSKVNLSNATLENYKQCYERNIRKSNFGKMKVKMVKKMNVQAFYAYLFKTRKYAPGHIQIYQSLLYPAFQMAVDNDIIRKNPCVGCMKEYVKGSMTSSKIALTKDQQDRLLQFIKNDNIYSPYYPMFVFMLGTGCRFSETIGITWDDIDFEKKQVKIDHQIIYRKKDGEYQYYASQTKNKESRIIPIQDNVAKALKSHKREMYFISAASNFEVDGYKNFVFLNRNGKLKTPNTTVRTFHGIRDAYNREEISLAEDEGREPELMPDFSPHTLRHTFCTRMAENGLDIKVLQYIMGHKNISVTMQVYNHCNDLRAQKAVESLENVMNI